jgi:hypothetical protein
MRRGGPDHPRTHTAKQALQRAAVTTLCEENAADIERPVFHVLEGGLSTAS